MPGRRYNKKGCAVIIAELSDTLWHHEEMTATVIRPSRAALAALIGVSLAGTADVGQFLLTRASMFTDAPGRAAGSLAGLVLWFALLMVSTARFAGEGRRAARSATVGLAGLVAVGNIGLAAIHAKAGVGGWRPILGGVLGILALGLAMASRDRPTESR